MPLRRESASLSVPIRDPIPELKRQVGSELARLLAKWRSESWSDDDLAAKIGTARARIWDLRRRPHSPLAARRHYRPYRRFRSTSRAMMKITTATTMRIGMLLPFMA